MIDKTPQITAFIKKFYLPGTIKEHAIKVTSSELLAILFDVFPRNCIDTDELYDILTALDYEPQKENASEFYWCLRENNI
jgi:hypothetical protein